MTEKPNPPPDDGFYMGCSAGGMMPSHPRLDGRVLSGRELEITIAMMKRAAKIALDNSHCRRDYRGAVIVKNGDIIGEGTNGPKYGICKTCVREDEHVPHKLYQEICAQPHAEQAAIFDAHERGRRSRLEENYNYDTLDSTMYHIRIRKKSDIKPDEWEKIKGSAMESVEFIKEGDIWKPFYSGPPSCTLCGVHIVGEGIWQIVLWRGRDEYIAYTANVFKELSLENQVRRFKEERDKRASP